MSEERAWIDCIGSDSHFKWLYSPLFPEGFKGTLLYPDPTIVKVKHLLTPQECEYFIGLSEGKFKRSTILLEGSLTHTNQRTSQTAYITKNGGKGGPYSDEIENVLRRVCILTGCLKSQIEGLMVVKYECGEEFQSHWDFFEEDGSNISGGQRIATFFVWLNDMEEEDGGHTEFTRLGLKCVPDKGAALFWWNQRGDEMLEDTEHRGSPVLKGTKYGLNVWIRFPGWQ